MASVPSTIATASPIRRLSPPSPSTSSTLLSFSVSLHHPSSAKCPRAGRLFVRSLTLDFSGSFVEGSAEDDVDATSGPSVASSVAAVVDKEEPQCPPGMRQYETMAVLRPDMSEDDRLALTQKYEELLVAGGGMYIEVFNRGVIPLAYSIKKKNKAGETNTYLDGMYLLFTYFTKPESMDLLESRLKTEDNVIRSSSFKIRKRKY